MPSPDYSGVYPWIRSRLQDNVADAQDTDFDNDIKSVIRRLLKAYPGHAYDALTGDDKDNMDEAVGLLVSARLLTPLSTGGAAFDLAGDKSDTTARDFAEGKPRIQDSWILEAQEAFVMISFVAASISASLPTLTAAAGRTRFAPHPPFNIYDLAFGVDDPCP